MTTSASANVSVIWDLSPGDESVAPTEQVSVPGGVIDEYTAGDEDAISSFLTELTGRDVVSWNWD